MMLSDDKKKALLAMTPDDITAEWMYANIAKRTNNKNGKFEVIEPVYNTNDTFYLEKGEYFNTEKVLTNVGLFIYNKLIIEGQFEDVLGYHNIPISDKVHKGIEEKLATALKYDKITPEQFANYLNRVQWLGLQFNAIIAASFSMKTVVPVKKVMDEKNKLFDDNKDKLEAGDIKFSVDVEKKLTAMAKEELKDDHGIDLYDSGARGNFANNYKTMCIMKGPVYSNGAFHTITNNYSDGIEKRDLTAHANAGINSQYPKSVGTQIAGYLFKRMSSGFQSIVADKPGSDCGTQLTIEVAITNANAKDFMDRYIVENGKVVLMTADNISKYIGKTVNLRSTMFCKGGNVKCNKCLGEIYYLLGIENVGLSVAKAATKILNLNMKKMHDASAKLYNIDLNDITL